jgi:hypothetical protein
MATAVAFLFNSYQVTFDIGLCFAFTPLGKNCFNAVGGVAGVC